MGRWSDGSNFVPNLSSLYSWVDFNWPLKGEVVKISQFGKALLLFDFEVVSNLKECF